MRASRPLLRQSALLLALLAWLLMPLQGALAQAPPSATSIAFVNVNVVPMDRDQVMSSQTVLIKDGRIEAIGPSDAITVPADAQVINGAGKYLAPGLIDTHVHLEGDGTGRGVSRPDFGDGPLYLAYGVTTIFNLRGLPTHLDWRRRIASGELIGPTIYTSGEFINEPRVVSADDVRREVASQARAGYDLLKYHEIWTRERGWETTTGLSPAAYRALDESAREAGIPLLGHAPVNLGLDALLETGQPLAHVGALSNLYFMPMTRHRGWIIATAGALAVLSLLVLGAGVVALLRRIGKKASPPSALRRVRRLIAAQFALGMVAAIIASVILPIGPMFDSTALRATFAAVAVAMTVVAVAALVRMLDLWRAAEVARTASAVAAVGVVASIVAATAVLAFWVPVAWRSGDSGIDNLAQRLRAAGVPVQTTLVNYDAVGGRGRARLVADPAIDYLVADTRARWRRMPPGAPPSYRYTDFAKKVTGALHRAGVVLLAGTDAMGLPLVAPGSSLHHELQLLVESGLTPYEALRAATIAPAQFLGKGNELGLVAPGARADLLLLADNPLENVSSLREPLGVMARGRWLARSDLQRMLAPLAQ